MSSRMTEVHVVVPDSIDDCPTEAGVPERHGCPVPNDADFDGVVDAADVVGGQRQGGGEHRFQRRVHEHRGDEDGQYRTWPA